MAEARDGAAAVLLPDGRILFTGGDSGSGAVSSADAFDSSGGFSAVSAMNHARSGHTAVVCPDGRVLVAGGYDASGAPSSSAELYDPVEDSWSGTDSLNKARAGATASMLPDGRLLIAGGEGASGALASAEVFDPMSEEFSTAGSMSSARAGHAAASLTDGRVLVAGGSNGSAALSSTEIFNAASDSFSAGPSLVDPRQGHSATSLLNGDILVAGGNNGSADLASAELLASGAGSFAAAADSLDSARSGHLAFRLRQNNAVLIAGGSSSGAPLSSAELYLPWTGQFEPTGSMGSARDGGAGSAFAQPGIHVVAGGSGESSGEYYGFVTVTTDKDDYAPTQIVTITGTGWYPGEVVTLNLHEDVNPPNHDDLVIPTVADASGNIFDNSFAPDFHDAGVRFYLTASGAVSGLSAQHTFTDKPAATIDQCANGGVGDPPVTCAGSAWQNGNLNEQHAHWFEGDFVAYRALITGVSSGDEYRVRIGWDITQGDDHTMDYISSFDLTEATADPCTGEGTDCGNVKTVAITGDPTLVSPFDGTQVVGDITVYGASSVDASGTYFPNPSTGSVTPAMYTDGSSDFNAYEFNFVSAVNGTVVLAWSGHISVRVDWDPQPTAIFINGSPYHMRLDEFECLDGPTNCSVVRCPLTRSSPRAA
jgi:hypothetical protein